MPSRSSSTSITLRQILDFLRLDPGVHGASEYASLPITGIEPDSRKVKAGNLFIALSGTRTHGGDYIQQALQSGAQAVLCSRAGGDDADPALSSGRVFHVQGLEQKVSAIAGYFYADPSAAMRVHGVTGTNGKTSVAFWLADLLAHLSGSGDEPSRVGLLGTLGARLLDKSGSGVELEKTGMTTPDAVATQRLMAEFEGSGCKQVAMEVSSHALAQSRVDAIQFRSAIFTNLSRDHLDYHKDLKSYADAKKRLFRFASLEAAIINIDDVVGREILQDLPVGTRAITYSVGGNDAVVRASEMRLDASGISAHVSSPWGEANLQLPFWGAFNLGNILAVLACACHEGFALQRVVAGLSQMRPVPGRLERLQPDNRSDVEVLVDYAHTPDAVEKVLQAARQNHSGRVITIVGCGGDRDAGKRPEMASAAESGSDRVVLTSDNPRSEPPLQILEQMLEGISAPEAVSLVEDRKLAIENTIADASAGDLILILGKGHEDYQEIDGEKRPFSDSQIALAALNSRCVDIPEVER